MVASGVPASLLASPSRMELLHLLQQGGPSPVAELARATGLHPNTVREHLSRLIEGGYVRSEPEVRTRRGRPRILYRVTCAADVRDDPEAQRRLDRSIAQAALTGALVRAFDPGDHSERAAQAGREVGSRLDLPTDPPSRPGERQGESQGEGGIAVVPSDEGDRSAPPHPHRELLALEAHLDAYGFDPVLAEPEETFRLWRCPYLELARERPDVVCSVHRGLAQGVLDQAGGSYEVASLTPFAGPDHCTLVVQRRPEGAEGLGSGRAAATSTAPSRATATASDLG